MMYCEPPMNLVCPRRNLFGLLVFLFGTLPAFSAQFYSDWAASRFNDLPAQAGPTNDPDGDGETNLVEFAFGTDPRVGGGITGAIKPVFGSANGTNGVFSVEIFERAGHQPGAQIDLLLSAKLAETNFFHPWWLRMTTTSQPSDPAGSIRETFTTRLPGNQPMVRSCDGAVVRHRRDEREIFRGDEWQRQQ